MKASPFLATVIASLFIACAHAGTLDDLESSSTKSHSSPSNNDSSDSRSDSDSSSDNSVGGAIAGAVAELIVEVMISATKAGVATMVFAGDNSMQRYHRNEPKSIDPEVLTMDKELSATNPMSKTEYTEFQQVDYKSTLFRTYGDPLLPTVKLSSQWLSGSDNINAQLHRIEAGYGLIGMSFSQNKLQEDGDSLTLSNLLMHYRMSFGNDFSWDIAYGRGRMNGNQEHNGSVFSMPIRYRYLKDWHVEYHPTWSSYKGGSLSEHQFSFNYHYKHVGATLGYKTWSAGATAVDGLFTGLYLSF